MTKSIIKIIVCTFLVLFSHNSHAMLGRAVQAGRQLTPKLPKNAPRQAPRPTQSPPTNPQAKPPVIQRPTSPADIAVPIRPLLVPVTTQAPPTKVFPRKPITHRSLPLGLKPQAASQIMLEGIRKEDPLTAELVESLSPDKPMDVVKSVLQKYVDAAQQSGYRVGFIAPQLSITQSLLAQYLGKSLDALENLTWHNLSEGVRIMKLPDQSIILWARAADNFKPVLIKPQYLASRPLIEPLESIIPQAQTYNDSQGAEQLEYFLVKDAEKLAQKAQTQKALELTAQEDLQKASDTAQAVGGKKEIIEETELPAKKPIPEESSQKKPRNDDAELPLKGETARIQEEQELDKLLNEIVKKQNERLDNELKSFEQQLTTESNEQVQKLENERKNSEAQFAAKQADIEADFEAQMKEVEENSRQQREDAKTNAKKETALRNLDAQQQTEALQILEKKSLEQIAQDNTVRQEAIQANKKQKLNTLETQAKKDLEEITQKLLDIEQAFARTQENKALKIHQIAQEIGQEEAILQKQLELEKLEMSRQKKQADLDREELKAQLAAQNAQIEENFFLELENAQQKMNQELESAKKQSQEQKNQRDGNAVQHAQEFQRIEQNIVQESQQIEQAIKNKLEQERARIENQYIEDIDDIDQQELLAQKLSTKKRQEAQQAIEKLNQEKQLLQQQADQAQREFEDRAEKERVAELAQLQERQAIEEAEKNKALQAMEEQRRAELAELNQAEKNDLQARRDLMENEQKNQALREAKRIAEQELDDAKQRELDDQAEEQRLADLAQLQQQDAAQQTADRDAHLQKEKEALELKIKVEQAGVKAELEQLDKELQEKNVVAEKTDHDLKAQQEKNNNILAELAELEKKYLQQENTATAELQNIQDAQLKAEKTELELQQARTNARLAQAEKADLDAQKAAQDAAQKKQELQQQAERIIAETAAQQNRILQELAAEKEGASLPQAEGNGSLEEPTQGDQAKPKVSTQEIPRIPQKTNPPALPPHNTAKPKAQEPIEEPLATPPQLSHDNTQPEEASPGSRPTISISQPQNSTRAGVAMRTGSSSAARPRNNAGSKNTHGSFPPSPIDRGTYNPPVMPPAPANIPYRSSSENFSFDNAIVAEFKPQERIQPVPLPATVQPDDITLHEKRLTSSKDRIPPRQTKRRLAAAGIQALAKKLQAHALENQKSVIEENEANTKTTENPTAQPLWNNVKNIAADTVNYIRKMIRL